MTEDTIKIDGMEEVAALPQEIQNAPVGLAHGLSSIALTMAMKYHDINTIQEGALYQQYKLEGKNIRPLDLDIVLDTAERLERWLVGSPDRISKIMIEVIKNADIEPEEDETAGDEIAPKDETDDQAG